MPVLEALPDETQMLRYKLLTLPKDVIGIPVISVTPSAVTFTSLTQAIDITPSTLNLQGGNDTMGYTAILSDDTVATLEVATDGGVQKSKRSNDLGNTDLSGAATSFLDDDTTGTSTTGKTITRTGSKFTIKAKPQANVTKTVKALLTIVGNETGGFKTVVVTVDPTQFTTLDIESAIAPIR